MTLLNTIVAFIVALGLLIVVHEYGHYLIARLCGVKVLRFSVGFGRALFAKRIGEDQTEWVIAAIPFGGYVKMLDEREGPVERARSAARVQPPERVAALRHRGRRAGGQFPLRDRGLRGPVHVRAARGAPGARRAARGHASRRRPACAPETRCARSRASRSRPGRSCAGACCNRRCSAQPLRLEVVDERGHLRDATLDLRSFPADDVEADALERVGLRLYRPPLDPVIGQVVSGGAAERAGLVPGDRVVLADGKPVESWDALVAAVQARPEMPLALTIERGGVRQRRRGGAGGGRGRPEAHRPHRRRAAAAGLARRARCSSACSTARARASGKRVLKTGDIVVFSLKMLGKMLVGEVSWKHLSGPVTIADFAGQSAQMGWVSYLTFLALISISLGVLNLLPIPLLDGGHLMYYAIEIVKGKPVSERAMELGQRVGLALLLVMMAFAFYNDLNRLLTG